MLQVAVHDEPHSISEARWCGTPLAFGALQKVFDACSLDNPPEGLVAEHHSDDKKNSAGDPDGDSEDDVVEVPIARPVAPLVDLVDSSAEEAMSLDDVLDQAILPWSTPRKGQVVAPSAADQLEVTPEKITLPSKMLSMSALDELIGGEKELSGCSTSGPTAAAYATAFKRPAASLKRPVASLKRPAASMLEETPVKIVPDLDAAAKKRLYSAIYHPERKKMLGLGMPIDEAKVRARLAANHAVSEAMKAT